MSVQSSIESLQLLEKAVNNEFKHLLTNFMNCMAAFDQAKTHCDERYAAMKQAGSALTDCVRRMQKHDGTGLLRGPYKITDNGHTKYYTEKEVEQLLNSTSAHLILDVPRMRLRYVKMGGKDADKPLWKDINWSICKVLQIGLPKPGHYFGNITIKRFFGIKEYKPRTLSRHMVVLTRLIQGRQTKGPYVWRKSGIYDESDTGYAYFFDEKFHYIVVWGRIKNMVA